MRRVRRCVIVIALLLASACGSGRPNAAQRADSIVRRQRELGIDMHYIRDLLISGMSSPDALGSCRFAEDDKQHRDNLQISFDQRRETADHWVRVEAGFIAGACPQRLPAFFASLNRIGLHQIASTVQSQLHRVAIDG
jgi:hypothetical protein